MTLLIILLILVLLLPVYLFLWCLAVLAGRQRPFNGGGPTENLDPPIDLSEYVTRKGSMHGHRPDSSQG